ncbi:hypothetical protein GCM10007382_04180 [Salinibacterium xinjiangense]|nr:hypothetical protein GCM10007382_04180 [Salinibacterium xinjiangense]
MSQQVDAAVTAGKFTATKFTGDGITADRLRRMTADLAPARSAAEQELEVARPRCALTGLMGECGVRVASGGHQHDPGPTDVTDRGLHPGCSPDYGSAIG